MKLISSIVLACAAAFAMPAFAEQPSVAAVAAKLKELYPQRQFGPVAHSPIPGLYEVVTGDSLSYVDGTGTYLLYGGQLMDFKRGINLSEQRLGEINRIDPAQLPLADAIKVVKGNGKRILYVFADPNCGFCKKLEGDLQGVDNVTVYTFLYPILQGSREKSVNVWCAADRQKAWDDALLRGVPPAAATCDNPVERNLALGQKYRVTATPTMVATDGRRLAGAVGAAGVNAFLDTAAAAKVAAK
jgi:thiol:disulfide interchange protein DsbC